MSDIFDALRKAQRDAEAERGPENGGREQEAGVPDSPQPPPTLAAADGRRTRRSRKRRIRWSLWSGKAPSRNGRADDDGLSQFSLEHGTAVGEQFRMLRTRIESAGPGAVMVTSALAHEGKTICAVNLARALAMGLESEVLLVDADLRHPAAADVLHLRSRPGLVDYLLGESSWQECIHPSGQERLSVIPAGASSMQATELLASERMEALVIELKSQYPRHYIVFDAPPLLLTADPLVLARHMDRVLLVVRADVTPRDAVVKAIETLGADRFHGIIFNGAAQQLSRSYYPGGYDYGRYASTDSERSGSDG